MTNRLFIAFLFIVLLSGSLSALTVDVEFDDPLSLIPPALVLQVESDISTALSKYDNMPDLAKGFGNANTYASYAATLRGYHGYDLFAVAVGSMISIQAPNEDPLFFMKLQDELDTGDIYAGVGGNPVVVEGGINLSFIVDGLYLSVKFGKYNYGIDKSSFKMDYKSNLTGVLLNYEILKEKSILSRIILWRGISVESGFIYSNNIVSFYKKLDALAPITSGTFTAVIDPSIDLVLDTKTVVIPIELYTSIRLLYALNIGVGGGVDYVPYGTTSFTLKSAGPIVVTSTVPAGFTANGTAAIDAGTKDVKPDVYRAKLMANIGLGIGPVFIDMPLTYYFTDNGYAAGLSAGMVW